MCRNKDAFVLLCCNLEWVGVELSLAKAKPINFSIKLNDVISVVLKSEYGHGGVFFFKQIEIKWTNNSDPRKAKFECSLKK